MTYAILWEFQVAPSREADFRQAYGPSGAWAQLFSSTQGFVSVELLACTEQDGRYLTVDRWASRAAFDAFRLEFAREYEKLDHELAGLTLSETRLGAFSTAG